MACFRPVPGWYGKELTANGKRPIVFRAADAYWDRPLPVPCGKCIGCQLEKARQWALRCMHEAAMHERNCFLTLTYDGENLPAGGSLVPEHFVLFMKRLRERYGEGIRFFHCGEYGERLSRPHHHCLLFNHDFDDKVPLIGKDGLAKSKELSRLWPFDFVS